MKNAKGFFLRLDRVRAYSRALLMVCFVIIWYFGRSMIPPTWVIVGVFTALCAVGSALRIPKQSDIAEFVSNTHAEFDVAVRRNHSSWAEEDRHTLNASSPKRVNLVRNIGNQMYFPEIYTMIFHREGDRMELFWQTLSLYDGTKPTRRDYVFSSSEKLIAEVGDAEDESEYRKVILRQGEDFYAECYVRNDHSWDRFVTFMKDYIQVLPLVEN